MSAPVTEPAARAAWERYFTEFARLARPLGNDGLDLRIELEAHAADAIAAGDHNRSEVERTSSALTRLGTPQIILGPLLADALLDEGTRSYNPAMISRGLWHAIRSGSRRTGAAVLFAMGYTLLAIFTAMALLKPLWGDHVGLFRYRGGEMAFGIASDTTGAQELLGLWVIPIAILLAVGIYVLLTRALRRSRRSG